MAPVVVRAAGTVEDRIIHRHQGERLPTSGSAGGVSAGAVLAVIAAAISVKSYGEGGTPSGTTEKPFNNFDPDPINPTPFDKENDRPSEYDPWKVIETIRDLNPPTKSKVDPFADTNLDLGSGFLNEVAAQLGD